MCLLTTSRCILNKPRPEDYTDLLELNTDEEVRKYLGGPVDIQVFVELISNRLDSDKGLFWIIRDASENEFIGSVSLGLHLNGIDTEISYQLLPRWWRNGYATEVVQRVIRYAFEDLGLEKVIAETQTANTGSCKLLKKVGMQLEQTLERYGAEQAIFCIYPRKIKR